jgi:hypothetical protein
MFQFTARALLVLGGLQFWVAPLTMSQGSNAIKEREIKVPSVAGEPSLRLKVSAEGRRGVLSVRNEGGQRCRV